MMINLMIGVICVLLANIYLSEAELKDLVRSKSHIMFTVLGTALTACLSYMYSEPGIFITFYMCSLFVGISAFTDIRGLVIDNEIIVGGIIMGVALLFVNPMADIVSNLLSFLIVGLVLFLIALITKESIGYGDAKLLAVVALFLGWKMTVAVILVGFTLSSLVGIVLLATKTKGRKDAIAFVPFLMTSLAIVQLI